LFFLDYFGCSNLQVETATSVIKGIAEGCRLAGCALIGGETAEMPGMYQGDDYDLAGFAVGVVERSQLLPSPNICSGDVLLGLTSSGLHSNGFSLVRKILSSYHISFSAPCPWDPSTTIGLALLEPTRIYVKQLLGVLRDQPSLIKGLCHITGGGFIENIPRILPKGCGAEIDARLWSLPPVFRWLMGKGNIAPLEMARTFNCGFGMVMVVGAEDVPRVTAALSIKSDTATCHLIGKVVGGSGVKIIGLEGWRDRQVRGE